MKERIIAFFKQRYQNANKNSKEISKWLWIFTISAVVLFSTLMIYISLCGIPTFDELENPKYDQASIIYDTNGQQFGKYYVENREPVEFKDLNEHIQDALLSTEDTRYYNHSGIDASALFRVALKSILLQKESSGGGSTISQQLAKLLYQRPSLANKNIVKKAISLVVIKLKEWITAVKLERTFTKEEIMAMYLNKFEFINGAHGIQAASETYFNKKQNDLNIEEAAMLVGMLKNPSLYNPLRFPDKAINRRNTVLDLMEGRGVISKKERDSLFLVPIDMSHFTREEQSDGPAPYFRAELTKYLQNLLKEKNIKKVDGSPYNIYTDGLKIYTTIDLQYQKYAEEAVKETHDLAARKIF